MKKICTVFTVILLSFALFGCDKKHDKKDVIYQLTEEKVTQTVELGDSVSVTKETKIRYTYDKNGFLTGSESQVFPNIADNTTVAYENDQFGNVIHKTVRNNGNIIEEDIRYTYDKAGNVLTEDKATSANRIQTITRTYDEKNRLLTVTTVNYLISSEIREEYTYDDEKRVVSVSFYKGGVFQKRQETQLDAKGRPLSVSAYYGNDNVYTACRYEYSDGKTSELIYNRDGVVTEKFITTFDKQGRLLTEQRYGSTGKIFYTTAYHYDENGNLIRKGQTLYSESHSDSTITEYTYQAMTR